MLDTHSNGQAEKYTYAAWRHCGCMSRDLCVRTGRWLHLVQPSYTASGTVLLYIYIFDISRSNDMDNILFKISREAI